MSAAISRASTSEPNPNSRHRSPSRRSFLANNHIRELEPLASCPRLQAVSLFRNDVVDLDAALLVFDSLPGATLCV
jgi:hypothetical protein